MNIGVRKTFAMPDGKEITIETGKLAKQAHGSVVITMGGTMLLAAVVSNEDAKEGVDFLPLTVEYQEKYGSTGRFPGGFFKREARPSENEILICRLVDRALRPLFPEDYHSDTTITINLISSDRTQLPDSLACLAASAALAMSNIPFNGPVSEVRVARVEGKLIINPTIDELKNADLDIIVAASTDSIVMVEGEMKEVQEHDMLEAIKLAHEAIKVQINAITELAALVPASQPKRVYSHETHNEEVRAAVHTFCYDKCVEIARSGNADKHARSAAFKAVKEEFVASLSEEELAVAKPFIGVYFHDVEKKAVRQVILNEGKRLDGRNTTTIRPIWGEVDYLPFAHGSAIFTRGETQSLTTVTLGTKMDEQTIDGAVLEGKSNFLLHYNFPSFSTGESRPNRGTSRREVGHGNLALRALKPMIPQGTDNPYTIRVVSDILESNGSSSMATVCAGTLALMDAGVKIAKPVSGIAMGLITDDGSKYAVLSDILGDEDHLGDMDFKVTGTRDGITACQMDIKVQGLSYEIMLNALNQAKEGRLHILGEMNKVLTAPREDYKPHAPRIVEIRIPKEFIGAVIGPGGKIIQEMQKDTQTVIVIEEVNEQGVVQISSANKANIDKALARIRAITATPEVGEVYSGKVKTIMPFGAFVEIMPGKDGLLHISEVEHRRLENLDGILKEGDIVDVKLIEVDKKTGKLKLSRKVLLPKPEAAAN
ncbi:MAG TPA: polyribonucleotide nucleotidyltransferase [Flavobacteriales bacterium]|nr:polyribonucleotide nucleotidyltransferase [Flavobacteriales bacterium]